MQDAGGPDALARCRGLLRDDAALQAMLGSIEDLGEFADALHAHATARGIEIGRETLLRAARPDPLGLRRSTDPAFSRDPPPAGWLPVCAGPFGGQICVDWAYAGPSAIREPLFDETKRLLMRRPLNCLAAVRTLLSDLPRHVTVGQSLAPSGFIFHMSRCGSTLVSQMLASDPRNVVISEAAPIDFVLRLPLLIPSVAVEVHDALLRAMVAALGRARSPEQRHLFVKLDSWHAMNLPLFRRVFPDVPWVFLFREPIAVLGSQMAERGVQTVPEGLPPSVYGLDGSADASGLEYCARVIGRICGAAAEHARLGGGLFVNYSELPQAVAGRILPHFDAAPDAQMREAMRQAVPFDAKRPGIAFAPRDAPTPGTAADTLADLAERHIGPAIRRLEALRGATGATPAASLRA